MNIREILKKHGFHYKKSLGQNFITDSNLLASIVNDSKTQKNDTVLEIGAGAGTLTRALSAKANRVVSFEKDKSLEPVLNEILKDCENTQIFFQDIKKVSDEALQGMLGDGFKVVANLPYYIAKRSGEEVDGGGRLSRLFRDYSCSKTSRKRSNNQICG
jgi:16S rRNA (adenine1518-N6/adenine1519-N6)-dimethyltransferase